MTQEHPRLNAELLARFIEIRNYLGIPSRDEVRTRMARLKVRTVTPPGWVWR